MLRACLETQETEDFDTFDTFTPHEKAPKSRQNGQERPRTLSKYQSIKGIKGSPYQEAGETLEADAFTGPFTKPFTRPFTG